MNVREPCISILKLNGAYLIDVSGWLTQDATSAERYSCAGSLRRAKQVGIEIAEEFGYVGPFRYARPNGGYWEGFGYREDDD